MKLKMGKLKYKNERGEWTKKSEWSTEDELYQLIYGLVRAVKPRTCLEVGTFEGDATVAIATALKENGMGEVYTLDEKDFGTFDKLHTFENVFIIRGRSPQDIPENKYDLIFLDSGHSYTQVSRELSRVGSMLTDGGYILLHDVINEKWGKQVRQAIREFLEKNSEYTHIRVNSYNGLEIVQKGAKL